ncbi:MAG: LacI family DNA-binding transcriptional regulator [bacterium]
MQNMTLQSIADELGLSKATVSLVLNGHAVKNSVSPVTAAKVAAYCAQHKYVINLNAQRASRKLVRNVGMVVFEGYEEKPNPMADYYEAMVVGGATVSAQKNGFSTTLIINHHEKELDGILNRFYAKEVDGFILSGFPVAPLWRESFQRENIPVVVVGGDPAQGLPTVNVNNYELSLALTRHVIGQTKRRHLGFISGGPLAYPGNERRRGFEQAMAEHGLTPVFDVNGAFLEDTAYSQVKKLFRRPAFTCDAIICANDAMAIGALRALREQELAVPRQIAIAGADDIPTARAVFPAISTYSLLPDEQGRKAFLLFQKIAEGKECQKTVCLKSELKLRQSA